MFSDLSTRIISAVALLAIAGIAFWMGGMWVIGLLIIMTSLMCIEYAKMLPFAPGEWRPLLIMVIVSISAILATLMLGWKIGILLLIMGAIGLYREDRVLWAWAGLGLLYIGGAAVALTIIYLGANGLLNVFWLVLVVILSDVGGYFVGRYIGGPKLWPRLSPKKTWSGTLGGWGLSAIAGIVIGLITPLSVLFTMLVCLILTVAAQGGDLLESFVKRRMGVKDSGKTIPGHGGLLDRFDGLLGASIVFAFLPGLY